MAGNHSTELHRDEPLPLHELISHILTTETLAPQRKTRFLPALGTMQQLNQRLANQPLGDFINYNLRGIGQVIFVNNPVSGLLILVALFLQSPWVAFLGLLGVVASTVTAIWLKLDRDSLRNGIFGYNGLLVGAALGTFGLPGNGAGNPLWAIAVLCIAALTTVMMKVAGVWFVTLVKSPLLTLPFNIATLIFLILIKIIPQPWFDLGKSAITPSTTGLDIIPLITALPIGFGQVFLADRLIPSLLIFFAVFICTPIGAAVGLLGSALGLLVGLILQIPLDSLYAGLWGYNAVLGAMAIGGVFYAPNRRSILIGSVCGFICALAGMFLGLIFQPLGLPIMTFPFCIVTIGFFVILRRSLPSLVPVALHTITNPEEHQQRFLVAKEIISGFRRQLEAAMQGNKYNMLFEQTDVNIKGDLRYIFDAIDRDRSGELSFQELANHLQQTRKPLSENELMYLFKSMDSDSNGSINFAEFGELILRYRRLMSKYSEFVTYFLPIDTNEDDVISTDEMNVAMASVGESPLSYDEVVFLKYSTEGQPLTWNRFIEVLLVT
jgi:urea transporter/Ca2+-binding EF-hand superfamily protein